MQGRFDIPAELGGLGGRDPLHGHGHILSTWKNVSSNRQSPESDIEAEPLPNRARASAGGRPESAGQPVEAHDHDDTHGRQGEGEADPDACAAEGGVERQ